MKITLFAKNTPQGYSGGRYHSWAIAESLVLAGHTVTYITNCVPAFLSDFAGQSVGSVRLLLSTDFYSDLPSESQDFVMVIPHLAYADAFFPNAIEYARQRGAKLILLNFESPNWFNRDSIQRDPALWENWVNITKEECLVLSLSKTGMEYAKEYYTRFPDSTQFDYAYPSINDRVADGCPSSEREKRIVVITRFSDGHKGADSIANIISDAMADYTLVIIVGNKHLGFQQEQTIRKVAAENGVKVEFLFAISDEQKFTEIKRAAGMLYLSVFEGYGYPPVEAGYCGTPCICFDLPVLREVNKDNVIYIPVGDYTAFREAVALFLKGAQTIRPNAGEYRFATCAAYAKKIDGILKRYQNDARDADASNDSFPNVMRCVCDYDRLLAGVARQVDEWQTNSVSMYGVGKNGYLLYGLLSCLGVEVSEVYDDACDGKAIGAHTTLRFEAAQNKDPVFVAMSRNTKSVSNIAGKVETAGRLVAVFG
jgi:glycosyltransferase involved in cell wall biosynthesis